VLAALEEKSYAFEIRLCDVARSVLFQRLRYSNSQPQSSQSQPSQSQDGHLGGQSNVEFFPYLLLRLDAIAFLSLYAAGELLPTVQQALSLGDRVGGCGLRGWDLTLLVEGLYEHVHKEQNVAMRKQVQVPPPAGAPPPLKSHHKKAASAGDACPFSTREEVDACLLELVFPFAGRVRYKLVRDLEASADYVMRVTRALCESEYRNDLSVLETTRAVRATGVVGGERPQTAAWFNALLQVPGVSDSRAAAIVEQFPTFFQLFRALAACPDDAARLACISEIKSADNGGRRLGPVIARRIVLCVFDARDGQQQLQ
jgi:hypothetical protein